MRDEFAWLKTNWLECVASDATLQPNTTRLAVMIAMHLNRQSKTAQVSMGLLAEELGIDERSARRLIGPLEARGLLGVSRRPGRGAASVFSLKLPTDYRPLLERIRETRRKPDDRILPGQDCPSNGDGKTDNPVRKGGQNCPSNPLMNPYTRTPARGAAVETSKGYRWGWPEFGLAWGVPIEGDRESAESAFEELSPAERVLAIGFVAAGRERAARREDEPCGAAEWLAERRWRPLVPTHRPGKFRLAEGSLGFVAWSAVRAVTGHPPLTIGKLGHAFAEAELPAGFAPPATLGHPSTCEPAVASDGGAP